MQHCSGSPIGDPHFASADNFYASQRSGGYCKPHARAYQQYLNRKLGLGRLNYWKSRARVLSAYGNVCVECGEDDPVVIQLDHIDSGLAKQQRGQRKYGASGQTIYAMVIREGFPDDYQLLCANCNIRKAAKERGNYDEYVEFFRNYKESQ